MVSMEFTKPSLTLWVKRLLGDRILAALIGCTHHSILPLDSYFDFMDRLWLFPAPGHYATRKRLPASWNSKKPDQTKGKRQKAQESSEKIMETIVRHLLDGKDIPFHFEARLRQFFTMLLSSLPCNAVPSLSEPPPSPTTAPPFR